MMDYSDVTTEDLRGWYDVLIEKKREASESAARQAAYFENIIVRIETELVRRSQGTTDDSAEWRELAIQ